MNPDNAELSCRQCRDAFVELTAGTLPTADRQAVERHLTSCDACRRERDLWLALGGAIREQGQRVPGDPGFARGLVRLRAALALRDVGVTNPPREDVLMERESRLSDRRPPTALFDAGRPRTLGGSRTHPYGAIAATAGIVLLAVVIFGALATGLHPGFGSGSPGSSIPTPTPSQSATSAASGNVPPLPEGATVTSISLLSASDGWAAARASNGSALLLRYDGRHWMPTDDTFAGISLNSISMDAQDDGWAVGAHSDQITGVVLHYSGGRWSQVPTPKMPFAGIHVWAFSPSRVLVVASLPKGQTGTIGSALLRYNNGAWTQTASPCGISGVSLLSADDLWATCLDGRVLHYAAGHWTSYSIGGQAAGQGGQPLSISMLSDTNGWLGGFTNAVPQGMFIAHFDGQAWTRVQGPAASGPTDINSLAMLSTDDGWAAGDLNDPRGFGPVLLHYTLGAWQAVRMPYSGALGGITMVSASEGWAAIGGGATAGLLHFYNGSWTPYDPNA